MQVDPTLMNVGDGGTVSREISAPSKVSTTMVGNPPQTLPPEFRGDVTLSHQNKTIAKNTKTLKTSLDTYNHTTGLSSLQQLNTAPVACSALIVTDKRANIPKTKAENTGVFSTPQWSSGVKVDREESLNPCRSNMTSSNQSKTQMQSQSAPPGFHCSTIFKPTQSVAFLPSTNFSSLCKITLPPALGQIAALREATASQFQKKIKPQSSGGTPLIRTYPYPFTAGQGSSSEKKLDTCTSKQKSSHLSNKNSKSVEHRSLASVVASPAIALPVQHPSLTSLAPTHYTMSPTAAICCGSALASLASQGRLLNPIDKSNSLDLTTITLMNSTIPTTSDDQGTSCSNESRDVPLDLSAKSKRPKCIKEPPGSPPITFKDESNQNNFVNSKRTFSSTFSSAVQYPLLPYTHRNGSHQKELRAPQNPHILDPKPCWSKGSSQDSIKNIPGTYVGVASPILASTLRGQDGKGTFADEFQSFAKQEFISIIDQGEHMASEEHKPSSLKSDQLGVKHVKNTSTKIPAKCLSKATLTATQSSSANKQIPKSGSGKMAVSYPPTVVSPVWQQPEDFSQQPLTLPRRNTSASPKNKNPLVVDESKNADYSLPSSEDKWEKIQSPLSNLASIVKQQSLDTAMFVSEGNAKPTPATSRKNNSLEKKEAEATEQCVPRLRRGRRRADESRLDLWGFATPSPPPTPPPPASPPPTPPQVARRPRGRPRSTPLPERGAQGKGKNTSADTEGPVNRKRQRCKNKRYQTGDYITDKDKLDDGDKPSGKRKFKSKHLCPTDEHPKRAIPPEVRRLIVNKNAGETLLQRAARLGYQDVVQYCLEKDQREVNRQDNAGYTALHEASSRGWVQIVQMLLKNGADVNCSAQDGTPIHDAVASDNLAIVWLLLNHGADPTLATYSGQTPVKLAHSSSMKTFLSYFTDLQGRSEHDPGLHWDFYSSTLFTEQEPCWDFLLSEQNQDLEQDMGVRTEKDHDKDCLVFEFSSEPLLQCYHVQVSLTQFCNWFLLTDVLKRVKMSARIFRARFPHLEVVSLPHAELMKQVSVSQVSPALASPHKGQNKDTDDDEEKEEEEGHVDLVRCVPELQKLLGSSIYILQDNEEEEEPNEDKFTNTGKLRSR
uniref:BCL-6 corepressor PCGF1 binding domain-containing protein n=1 Tax=Periophthalmus magnuspinnatus TaxID=409849 RepID=A0A3B3ZTL1_9GOBI